MSLVDFDYVDDNTGYTIYKQCFSKYLTKYRKAPEYRSPELDSELSKLATKTEAVFAFLVEQGTIYGFNGSFQL